jgi:hypothetical protein
MAPILLCSDAAAAMGAKQTATFHGGSVSASKIQRFLEHRPVKLTNVKVKGAFYLLGGSHLEAKNVTFKGTVEGAGACEVCPLREGDKASASIENGTFKRQVDFYGGPEFASFECTSCVFSGFVYWHSLQADSLDLLRSVFEDDVILAAANIKDFNLADAAFRRELDLSGASIADFNTTRIRASEPILTGWSELGGDRWAEDRLDWARYDEGSGQRPKQVEAEFRFWKRNFADIGDKPAELKANYYLIKLNRELEFDPTHLDWWAAVILGGPSAFGTKPFRPLLIAAVLVALFAIVYWVGDCFRDKDHPDKRLRGRTRPLFATFFSLDTFIPVIKLSGVDDWEWRLHGGWRWLGVAEKVFGVLLTAAAAYSVGTYFV